MSDCSELLSVVLLYLDIRWILVLLHCKAYSLVWQEAKEFCVEHLAVFSLPSPTPPLFFPLIISVLGCLSSWG